MAVVRGRASRVRISVDGGTNYFTISKQVDPTFQFETSEIATTNHDSGAFEESIPGRMSGVVECPCRYDRADTNGQIAAIAAQLAQTIVKIRWEAEGNLAGPPSGSEQYTADAWVQQTPYDGPNDDVQSMNLSFKLTGTITRAIL